MEAILESNKSLWKRTGNMALVVVGALSIFLASVEEVHLYVILSLSLIPIAIIHLVADDFFFKKGSGTILDRPGSAISVAAYPTIRSGRLNPIITPPINNDVSKHYNNAIIQFR